MRDKLLIFMCSLVLTLAATGSALAATESATGSATGLVLAATELEGFGQSRPGHGDDDGEDPKDDPRCPAKNRKKCEAVKGYFSKNGSTKTCVKREYKKCPRDKKGHIIKETTWTKMPGVKCKERVVEKDHCKDKKW